MLKKEKKCPRCKVVKPVEDFVTVYGYVNPRGKYCMQCFNDREQEFVSGFLDGRDFCLYCGKPISKYCDWTPDGKSKGTYVNLDHMDPLCLGGEDSNKNTVYCCTECNRRKGKKLFMEWLGELETPYKKLARRVYEDKHGRIPEDFEPEPEVGIEFNLTYLQEDN